MTELRINGKNKREEIGRDCVYAACRKLLTLSFTHVWCESSSEFIHFFDARFHLMQSLEGSSHVLVGLERSRRTW